MTKANGKSPDLKAVTVDDTDRGLGEYIDQFQQPIRVGVMTVPEVAELKARNKIIARLSEDIDHLAKSRALISNEKIAFIRSIGSRVGLGPRDELTVDDESGAINHVAVRRFVQPDEAEAAPEVIEGDAVPVPAPVN